MTHSKSTVLIIDDDPQHLRLYSWILERGGFRPVTALVGSNSVAFPEDQHPDVVALDYRLSSSLTSVDVARMVQSRYPGTPILVLSELPWMPDNIAPYAQAFVNKGEPDQLLETLAILAASHAHKSD